MRQNEKLHNIVTAAVFAAAVTVTTAYILHIPLPTGGYVHVGDALIYLAASMLPLPYAMAAGAIGGALADLLTAPMWALPTFVIKAAICLPFTRQGQKLLCRRNVIAMTVAGLLSPTLYAFVNVFFTGTWNAFLPQFLGTLIQGVGSGVVYAVLAYGLDKVGLKQRVQAA